MKVYLLTAAGVLLLSIVAYDVYATILHARGRSGPISESINRIVWRIARWLSFRLSRSRRHQLLNAVGPLLLPLIIAVNIFLLITGFAFIYYPRISTSFVIAPGSYSSAWSEALYFSGITLTTVGYGDVAPHSNGMRIISLIEGASGFALISLAITYLITVYGALQRKRAVALSFYHQASEGADAASFIAHHFVLGRFVGLETVLRTAARDIQELLESHFEHPIIHYFHPLEVHKSLPRVLFLILEICTVINSCLDGNVYVETVKHPEVRTLDASGRHVLGQLAAALGIEQRQGRGEETHFEESRRWRKRFQQTMSKLQESGIKTRSDVEAGWNIYRAQREEWESQLSRLASFLGYDWDEVTGDRDLRYAADEEMEEPRQELMNAE